MVDESTKTLSTDLFTKNAKSDSWKMFVKLSPSRKGTDLEANTQSTYPHDGWEKRINWKENPMKNYLWKVGYWWRPPYNVLSALSRDTVPRLSTVNSIWVCDALEWRWWWKYFFRGRGNRKELFTTTDDVRTVLNIHGHLPPRPLMACQTRLVYGLKATYVLLTNMLKKMDGRNPRLLRGKWIWWNPLRTCGWYPSACRGANRLPASVKTPGGGPVKQRCPREPLKKKNGNFVLQHSGFDVGNGEILTNVRCGDDLMLYEKHCDECIFYDGKIHWRIVCCGATCEYRSGQVRSARRWRTCFRAQAQKTSILHNCHLHAPKSDK